MDGVTGTCPMCGQVVPVVNFRAASWPLPDGGYLGRHWRPGLRQGYKCRGSFGVWLERRAHIEEYAKGEK